MSSTLRTHRSLIDEETSNTIRERSNKALEDELNEALLAQKEKAAWLKAQNRLFRFALWLLRPVVLFIIEEAYIQSTIKHRTEAKPLAANQRMGQ